MIQEPQPIQQSRVLGSMLPTTENRTADAVKTELIFPQHLLRLGGECKIPRYTVSASKHNKGKG
jgi:hypothetical protein